MTISMPLVVLAVFPLSIAVAAAVTYKETLVERRKRILADKVGAAMEED